MLPLGGSKYAAAVAAVAWHACLMPSESAPVGELPYASWVRALELSVNAVLRLSSHQLHSLGLSSFGVQLLRNLGPVLIGFILLNFDSHQELILGQILRMLRASHRQHLI